jgi:TPR repeat protein
VQSDFVRDEAGVGRDRGVLVPARIDGAEPPLGFGQYQAEKFNGFGEAPEAAKALERLVAALERLRGQSAPILKARDRREDLPPKTPVSTRKRVTVLTLAGAALAVIGLGLVYPPESILRFGGGTSSPTEPAGPALLGAVERYGLSDAEIAGLSARSLAEKGLEKSDLEVVEAAAAENDTLSLSLLCVAHYYGVRTSSNIEKAASACTRAKNAGAPLGGYMLSLMARNGNLPEVSAVQADAWLREAADAGDSRAQFERSLQLQASAELSQARRMAEMCAARGNVDCRFLVAQMQAAGVGGPKDLPTAVSTYQVLVEPPFFHPAATRELALLHLSGGVSGVRSLQPGIDLLKRAEILGDGAASFQLGQLSEAGSGMPKDPGVAMEYYQRALENGYAPAQDEIDRLRTRTNAAPPVQ